MSWRLVIGVVCRGKCTVRRKQQIGGWSKWDRWRAITGVEEQLSWVEGCCSVYLE
jgi:hypothetical protein